MNPLDPHTIPLQSLNLIEASAGTGKSWTVTYLFLRTLLESDPALKVDQILVVTFTDAAAKELREKIRERVVEALAVFENPQHEVIKEEYKPLLARTSSHERAIKRLRLARLSMDEASIFTIHGFCSRALRDYAFDTGLPFELETIEDDSELILKLADDYWRGLHRQFPEALLHKIKGKETITPDTLVQELGRFIGKPYLKIVGPSAQAHDIPAFLTRLETAYRQMVTCWRDSRDVIVDKLSQKGVLNGQSFGEKQRQAIFALFDALPDSITDFAAYSDSLKILEKPGTDFLETKTNKNQTTPRHEFFIRVQCYIDLQRQFDSAIESQYIHLKIALLDYLRVELPKEKQRLGVLSFDDLLLSLDAALSREFVDRDAPVTSLADRLRARYPVAMIDEFQDTDPIQYRIFSKIYLGESANDSDQTTANEALQALNNAVFLVGDPKQSIYSFRNGDIYTYLKAKKAAHKDKRFTLNVNWRSHASLIQALNTLYGGIQNPFRDESIQYVQVDSCNKVEAQLQTGGEPAVLRFWEYLPAQTRDNADEIQQRIADSVATDIAALLIAASAGNARIGDKPLSGGDIAVLVRTHRQGDQIKQALNRHGVASVQSGKDSVFDSLEAVEMHSLMQALIEPQHDSTVRRALVTDMLGKKADDLLAYEVHPAEWDALLGELYEWHQLWQKHGFMPMMRQMMDRTGMYARLLSFPDGERRLTNLLHLTELIHNQSRQHALGLEETLRWFAQQMAGTKRDAKSAELRLESDENLVKIVTIHKSKGLEYPLVYCPFVGLGNTVRNKNTLFNFHDGNENCLDVGSDDREQHLKLKQEQALAEDARLLYVALTRAKYQLTVVCFPQEPSSTKDNSALGWLLTNGKLLRNEKQQYDKSAKEAFYSAYQDRLVKLAEAPGIQVEALPPGDDQVQFKQADQLVDYRARVFSAVIRPQAQITSFSTLTSGMHEESPDHDAQWFTGAQSPLRPLQADEFPRGATAGSALHEIYENLDFTRPVSQQQKVIDNALARWGFADQYTAPASYLVLNSLKKELFKGLSLSRLSNKKRLNELEFYLPLKPLSLKKLQNILLRHLPEDGPVSQQATGQMTVKSPKRINEPGFVSQKQQAVSKGAADTGWQQIRRAVKSLGFDRVEGFLKGFVDLVFEHDGRFYVVDYKSNSLADYSASSLFSAMADSHYYLQYLLYCVALHRYLGQRVSDYNWETHVGGVFYLFIRGMGPLTADDGPASADSGIFYHKPSVALINALDSLFQEPSV